MNELTQDVPIVRKGEQNDAQFIDFMIEDSTALVTRIEVVASSADRVAARKAQAYLRSLKDANNEEER